jgi:riboflavin kinase / FMN hydrolase
VQEKTVEPWILYEFEHDFYGEELRLVVGYSHKEQLVDAVLSMIVTSLLLRLK